MARLKGLLLLRLALGLVLSPRALGAAIDNGFLDQPVSFARKSEEPKAKVADPAPATAAAEAQAPKPVPKPKAAAQPDSATAAALSDLQARLAALEAKPAAVLPFKLEGFADLRYDHQSDVVTGYGALNSSAPTASLSAVLGSSVTASRGSLDTLYMRRAEFKLTAEPKPWAKAVLGWELSENKLKDWGLSLEPNADLKLQVGQFRQRFGLEAQVGSSKTWFIERALIYGGAHPFSAGPTALAKERSAGLHAWGKRSFGPLSADLGASVVQNATEDQAANQSKPGSTAAFPATISDHAPSWTLRGGLESGAIPAVKKLSLGASWLRDSQNTRPDAADPSQQQFEEALGFDASAELFGALRLQGEWVRLQRLNGTGTAPTGVWLGLTRQREGSYYAAALQLLKPFLGADAPSLELLARHESCLTFNVGLRPGSFGASTLGLRWDPLKLWHTALNYTVYDVDGDAGALGGTELLSLQQQFAF